MGIVADLLARGSQATRLSTRKIHSFWTCRLRHCGWRHCHLHLRVHSNIPGCSSSESADVDCVDDDGPDGLTNEELQGAEQAGSDIEGLACPQGQSSQHHTKATAIDAHWQMLLAMSVFVVSTRADLLAVICAQCRF